MRTLLIALALATLAAGCIGAESSEPPVVGIRNMYNQPRYDTQERQPFFADQRSMRPQVAGTVSREMTKGFAHATGLSAQSKAYIDEVPRVIIAEFGTREAIMARGQDRYDIYCAPCHSFSGDGKGMVSRRAAALGAAALVAPTFHDDRLRHIPDGQLFATITNGVRNMPSYAHNLPVNDRWAIVQYVRALQLSQAPAAATENTEQSQ
ncbi:MAG: cytochrome c [Deltaproteobacteria bacterium]|nr:cytochrome c [Deltaproteobacteria bacterium]